MLKYTLRGVPVRSEYSGKSKRKDTQNAEVWRTVTEVGLQLYFHRSSRPVVYVWIVTSPLLLIGREGKYMKEEKSV